MKNDLLPAWPFEMSLMINCEFTWHGLMATARRVVISHDANLRAENGGYIDITKDWAKRILQRMNMVKHQGTIKAKVMPSAIKDTVSLRHLNNCKDGGCLSRTCN